MLQPAAITALLSHLINDHTARDAPCVRPHTALLTLLDSSEIYAVATTLVESPPSSSAVASILASTAAAARTAPPPQHASARRTPFTLDERAACLSAIAVTCWRQATQRQPNTPFGAASNVVLPGASVSLAKHGVTRITRASAKHASSTQWVPLLLECDLGSILVMPVVPDAPNLSASSAELAALHHSHHHVSAFSHHPKPFMLLTLNAASHPPPAILPKSPSTPHAAPSPPLASSTATLSATNPARSRLRSGGTTPTSTRSHHTPTPSRSPVSHNLPITHAVALEQQTTHSPSASAEHHACHANVWRALYAQANALASVLAPSLTRCGVAQYQIDQQRVDARQSGMVSDDDVDC